jgi:hypothetical protein
MLWTLYCVLCPASLFSRVKIRAYFEVNLSQWREEGRLETPDGS